MRKLVIAAALAAVALGASAGCTTASPTADGTSAAAPTTTAPTTTAADITAQVCAEAKTYNETTFAALNAKFTEITAALVAQDQAKYLALLDEAQNLRKDWEAKLVELAAKGPKDEVKKELNDMVTVIKDDTVTLEQVKAAYAKETGELATACA